jgi:uncharacterized OB-fold protein
MAIATATVRFPPSGSRKESLSADLEWFEVTGTGVLIGFSKLTCGSLGLEEDLPRFVAAVDHGDHKVFVWIAKGIPDEALSIGKAMKMQPVTLSNGQLSYVFTKA